MIKYIQIANQSSAWQCPTYISYTCQVSQLASSDQPGELPVARPQSGILTRDAEMKLDRFFRFGYRLIELFVVYLPKSSI